MIMIKVAVTVQLVIKMDGGIIAGITLTSIISHLMLLACSVLFSEMKIRPKDCITQ